MLVPIVHLGCHELVHRNCEEPVAALLERTRCWYCHLSFAARRKLCSAIRHNGLFAFGYQAIWIPGHHAPILTAAETAIPMRCHTIADALAVLNAYSVLRRHRPSDCLSQDVQEGPRAGS